VAAPSVRFHPDAIAEAKAAYAWYAERNPSAANAFISELDHAISQIQNGPERWTMHLQGTRRFLLRRFPYAVVYRSTQSTIQVSLWPMGAAVLAIGSRDGLKSDKFIL
jgi:plasmid stabilization system protein ParE